jgi:putative Mn2+ efflux pump MntP
LRIQPVGQNDLMAIGTSILLIAVGAILRFAISDSIEGVDLSVVGLILMIVGAIGLVIGLWITNRYTGRSGTVTRDDRYVRDDRY